MEFDGTTASEVQVQIIDTFNDAGDAFNQFTYLLQLASEFPELPAERKVEQALVKGCQSQVWLYTSVVDDGAGVPAMHIEGDSDTLMVRGVIRIYVLMFEGRRPEEVLDTPIDFIGKTELASIFDDKRKAGASAIYGRIAQTARDYVGKE